MTEAEIISEIKSGPHCRMIVRPNEYQEQVIHQLSEIKELLENSIVRFRGWDFPHIDRENMTFGNNYLGSYDKWRRSEMWRFYQSGQFIYLFQFHEDFLDKEFATRIYYQHKNNPKFEEKGYVDFIMLLSTIAEIYELTYRLLSKNLLQRSCTIIFSMIDVSGRLLSTIDPGRSLLPKYQATETNLEFNKTYDIDDFSDIETITIQCVKWFYERFGWHQPSEILLKNELLEIRSKSF
ncbi:hypothetical protein [Leptospira adleri]|uniref:Uncharacterized protein n=1 Tax=Leptospira adleri TaxID=2023186 RepID=A0ABX4NRM2_9LEPT|nr:hypothetical protein [Leptospira adleri]PJZ59458.1 hypothetical protein CH376_23610 [Leptospira adleri]